MRAGSFKSLKDFEDYSSDSHNNSHIMLNFPKENLENKGDKMFSEKFRGKSCITDMNKYKSNVESQSNSVFSK